MPGSAREGRRRVKAAAARGCPGVLGTRSPAGGTRRRLALGGPSLPASPRLPPPRPPPGAVSPAPCALRSLHCLCLYNRFGRRERGRVRVRRPSAGFLGAASLLRGARAFCCFPSGSGANPPAEQPPGGPDPPRAPQPLAWAWCAPRPGQVLHVPGASSLFLLRQPNRTDPTHR